MLSESMKFNNVLLKILLLIGLVIFWKYENKCNSNIAIFRNIASFVYVHFSSQFFPFLSFQIAFLYYQFNIINRLFVVQGSLNYSILIHTLALRVKYDQTVINFSTVF